MENKQRRPDMLSNIIAAGIRKKGFEYTAQYVEMFGLKAWNPAFKDGPSEATEDFYKKCVEEGHTYDWYTEHPEETET